MKNKSTSQSAFFNLRVILASAFCLGGVFLALAQIGVFSVAAQSMIQGMTAEVCPANHYDIHQIRGSIVPGTTDIGNHGDNQVTTVALPFSYTLYDQTFNAVNLSSNGNAQFTTLDTAFTNQCLPWLTHNYAIFPYWDDLRTDNLGWAGCTTYPNGLCGIFTSITGIPPNRIFNIEWRAVYFANTTTWANFELRLYEGQSSFDVFYGTVDFGNSSATAGVQKDDPSFDQYFCNGSGGRATRGQWYTLEGCPGQITLYARGYKVHGLQTVDLFWSGPTSGNIDIYRNRVLIATVPNQGGFYTDHINRTGRGTYTYRVCEAGSTNCSNQVTVTFGSG